MNTTTFPTPPALSRLPHAARLALALLERIRHGSMRLQLPDGSARMFGRGEPAASMQVDDWEVFNACLARGDIGLAETFMAGGWTTSDLAATLSLLVHNRGELEGAVYGSVWMTLLDRLRHLRNRNSRAGSRRNIEAHYDLGNAFYRLWLDGTMNYSSALFTQPGLSMEAAQGEKVRRALVAAGVKAGDRVLEIGCGWGALAETAAGAFGAHVTGVTLSHEQLAFAQQRLARLGNGTDLRLQDYRDIADGPFDAVCSIEMVEAVGRAYWPTYFSTVARLLKPGGHACIQSIVIADALWDRYASGTDFIQQYIFPGGCLPCPREFMKQAKAAGLEVVESFAFGPDYARTLRYWRERFMAQRHEVMALGFDARFIRMWEFYLCYCEAAFIHGNTDVVQYTLRKPAP
ncbi:MAG: class I SAM-dependent methyltransferase [Burkholderiales bacterium]|nr:class I SAM-dependent methyltransferase [Burkholderiales bacterium]